MDPRIYIQHLMANHAVYFVERVINLHINYIDVGVSRCHGQENSDASHPRIMTCLPLPRRPP